jgi:hypothetical protein
MDSVIVAAMQIWCSPSIRGTDPFVLAMPCLSKGKSCWFYIGQLVASVANHAHDSDISTIRGNHCTSFVRQHIQQFQSFIDQRSHIAPK